MLGNVAANLFTYFIYVPLKLHVHDEFTPSEAATRGDRLKRLF